MKSFLYYASALAVAALGVYLFSMTCTPPVEDTKAYEQRMLDSFDRVEDRKTEAMLQVVSARERARERREILELVTKYGTPSGYSACGYYVHHYNGLLRTSDW